MKMEAVIVWGVIAFVLYELFKNFSASNPLGVPLVASGLTAAQQQGLLVSGVNTAVSDANLENAQATGDNSANLLSASSYGYGPAQEASQGLDPSTWTY